MKNCWRQRSEERPNFTQMFSELKEMNDRYTAFQPTTHQLYMPNSHQPTFSTFMQPPKPSFHDQPIATSMEPSDSFSEPISRRLLTLDPFEASSEPLNRRHRNSRASAHISLSFSGLSDGESSESEDEPGGGSFPSTLKSRGSTIKPEGLKDASESISTLQPPHTPLIANRSVSPDESSKTSPFDGTASGRSSILLPATTHSLKSTSGTDCSSFVSTGLDSMNTTFSTPTPAPVQPATLGGIELRTLADEKRRNGTTATGCSNRSSGSSNPAHSITSVSPQTEVTTKSTDSGIRSDEDSGSDGQGHQEARVAERPSRQEQDDNLFRAPPQTETSFSESRRESQRISQSSDPFGLGLGDMSSELFAAISSISTFKPST